VSATDLGKLKFSLVATQGNAGEQKTVEINKEREMIAPQSKPNYATM
jgi:hypothetical protein